MSEVAQIREVRVLGPALPGGDGRSLWVAHFTARLDQNLTASGDFMRNASLRVLSEAAVAREDYVAVTDRPLTGHKTAPFRDPRLLTLAVRPEAAWFSGLFLEASDDGQKNLAGSHAVTAPGPADTRGPFALATVVPELTSGRWPNKQTGEIETPPLRLAAGGLDVAISKTADPGLWRALGLGDPTATGGPIPILWDGGVSTQKMFVEPWTGGFEVADLSGPPPPGETEYARPRPTALGAPPRVALRLTAEGVEFDALLRLSPGTEVKLRARIEPDFDATPGGTRVRLALVAEQDPKLPFRSLIDRLAAAVPKGLAFNVRTGPLTGTWDLTPAHKHPGYTLSSPGIFALAPASVRATITTDPAPGIQIGTTAQLRLRQCRVIWNPDAQHPNATLSLQAGPENQSGAKATLTFEGKSLASVCLAGDAGATSEVNVYVPPPAADTYIALERGALWLPSPSPSAETTQPQASPRSAFDGLVYAQLTDPAGGGLALTVEAAVAATVTVTVNFDLAANGAATSLKVELFGPYGSLDGALWTFRSGPSVQEMVPARDGGPIALKSVPLVFGEPPSGASWPGTMSPIANSAPPSRVTLTAPAPETGWAAVHWAPIRDPGRAPLPLVSAMNMTRTAANTTAPSQSRDLIPQAFRGKPGGGTLKITLSTRQGKDAKGALIGSLLPNATIALDKAEGLTGWADIVDPPSARDVPVVTLRPKPDVPMAVLTLPGVEFTVGGSTKATLRYDLPVLDELFASGSPRRPPAPEPATGPAASSLAGGIPAPLLEAWREALRRRALARTREDVFWTEPGSGQTAAQLAYPFQWDGLDVALGLGPPGALPLGRYRINGEAEAKQGEQALAGLSLTFRPTQTDPPTLKPDPNGPIKVTGFALAPYPVKITAEPHGGETVDAIADTAGQALARGPDQPTAAWTTRIARVWPDDGKPAIVRRLLTTWKPIPVALGVKDVFLSVRDLPLDVNGDPWTFTLEGAPEGAAGPDPSVFERWRLASSIYEWRHYGKPQDATKPAFEIDLGWLRLRPLRLASLNADGAAKVFTNAVIIYSAVLARQTDPAAFADSPFAADLAYSTGNLLAISFVADGTGGLKADKLSAVGRKSNGEPDTPSFAAAPQVTLRAPAKILYRGGDAWPAPETARGNQRPIEFGFILELADGKVRPRAKTGFVSATAFSLALAETGLDVSVANGRLRLEPPQRTVTGAGLAIQGIGADIGDADAALLIDAELRLDDGVAHADGPAPIRMMLGAALNWYGATLPISWNDVVVDHDRGFLQVGLSEAKGPLLRGLPEFGAVKGYLVVSFAAFAAPVPLAEPVALDMTCMEVAASFAGDDEDGGVSFRLGVDKSPLGVDTRPSLSLRPSARRRSSVIYWPIDALNDAGHATALKDTLGKTAFAGVEAQAELVLTPGTTAVMHDVEARFEPVEIELSSLAFQATQNLSVWFLRDTLWAQAHCTHTLSQKGGKKLAFSSFDDVALVDLIALSNETLHEYAFSPRYRAAKKDDDGRNTPPDKVPSAGIVHAPIYGTALRVKLAANKDPIWPGLAMFGGAVVEWPIPPQSALALTAALPWLAPLHNKADGVPLMAPLNVIAQAPTTSALNVFITAFDLAGAIPLAFNPAGRIAVAAGAGSLDAALKAALEAVRRRWTAEPFRLEARRCADLAFASDQTPAPPAKDPAEFPVPVFWRTLLALKRLFKDAAGTLDAATVIGDTELGVAHRITIRSADTPPAEPQDSASMLIAIGRDGARKAILSRAPEFSDIDSLRRLAALAESLVKAPFATYVARVLGGAGAPYENLVRVPMSLGGAPPSPRVLRDWSGALHASPALGWPRHGGLDHACSLGLTLGDETPLQDAEVAWAGRGRRLAGALVAPAAPDAKLVLTGPYPDTEAGEQDWNALAAAAATFRMRLAAQAAGAPPVEDWPKLDTLLANVAALAADAVGQKLDRWNKIAADYNLDNKQPLSIPVVTRASVAHDGGSPDRVKIEPGAWFNDARFLAVGRRIAFDRTRLDDAPVVTAPADRGLTPVPSRARAPTPQALADAFKSAGVAPDAPRAGFLPGHYEIVATGVRPGAMAFEHEGIVTAGEDLPFDPAFDRFGRPADRMPLVWRQGRAPRSTGLPRTKDLNLSRRSFVAQNLVGKDVLLPVALIADAGEVIRYSRREIAAPKESDDEAIHAILVRIRARPGIDDDVEVVFARPDPDVSPPLVQTLARLGFLRGGADGLAAALTVGAARVDFAEARFELNKTDGFDLVRLTLTKASGRREIVAAVAAADGDTRAILTLTAGKTLLAKLPDPDPAMPLTLATQPAPALVPGPPRVLSLRLPLAPLNKATAPVCVVTTIFGDAAYDRELASRANAMPSKPDAPKESLFAADRTAYDLGETVHLAFGEPNPKFKQPDKGQPLVDPFVAFAPGAIAWLSVELAPQPVGGIAQPQRELRVAGWARDDKAKAYKLDSPGPFALPLPALQETSGAKAGIAPGDRLVLTARRDDDPASLHSLTLSCDLVAEPVIAPPAAVYGLVTLDRLAGDGEETALAATPALFASAPLPSRVEFPDLLADLVRGHVRRAALFVWSFAARAAPASGAPYGGLVKIDRTGGGQIPTDEDEFQPVRDFKAAKSGGAVGIA